MIIRGWIRSRLVSSGFGTVYSCAGRQEIFVADGESAFSSKELPLVHIPSVSETRRQMGLGDFSCLSKFNPHVWIKHRLHHARSISRTYHFSFSSSVTASPSAILQTAAHAYIVIYGMDLQQPVARKITPPTLELPRRTLRLRPGRISHHN